MPFDPGTMQVTTLKKTFYIFPGVTLTPGGVAPKAQAGGTPPRKGQPARRFRYLDAATANMPALHITQLLDISMFSLHLFIRFKGVYSPPQSKTQHYQLFQIYIGDYASKSDTLPGAGRSYWHVLPEFLRRAPSYPKKY